MGVKIEAATMQATKARSVCGRSAWVFWNDRSGQGFAARYSTEAVKAAMLACGTAKKFFTVNGGIASAHRWRDGCRILRNAAFGC